MLQTIPMELPVMARPALVGWQAGGRQEFPDDPIAAAAHWAAAKAAGLFKVRRIPAPVPVLN